MYIKTWLNISDHSSAKKDKKDSIHTTPHILYIYNYIYISSTSQSNYIYIHTYIHTHIGGKYVYDYFIVSHCKPDFGWRLFN